MHTSPHRVDVIFCCGLYTGMSFLGDFFLFKFFFCLFVQLSCWCKELFLFFSFFFLILRNISRTRLWSVEVSARGMCVYNTDRSLLQHCCYSVRWPGSSQWWIKGINTHNLTGVWNNTENNTWFFFITIIIIIFPQYRCDKANKIKIFKKEKTQLQMSLGVEWRGGGHGVAEIVWFLRLNTPVVNMGYRWEIASMQWSCSPVHEGFF